MSGPAGPSPAVRVGVAIPAAGAGVRMGGVRKPFVEVAGRPMLAYSLDTFLAVPRVVAVVVALSADDAHDPPDWLRSVDPRVSLVAGGATRTESVRAALAAIPDDVDVIAVHDAARPLVTRTVVDACIDVAATGFGAVAGRPATDTLKLVDRDGRVLSTPDRDVHWHAHTPQVFPAPVFRSAYAWAGADGTDDATLVEALGGDVRMVDDGATNLKITHPEDVAVAEALLSVRAGGS